MNGDQENAEIFNKFFSNAVKNLKIPEYQEADSHANNTSHSISKAIMKFRNHPSITAMKNLNKGTRFDFCRRVFKMLLKRLRNLTHEKLLNLQISLLKY